MAAISMPLALLGPRIATTVGWLCSLSALLVFGCGPDAPSDFAVADSTLSWFPLEPSSIQLAQGDSTQLLLAVRDSAGDTLGIAGLPPGRFAYQQRYPPILTIRYGSRDTLLAVFQVHVSADSVGTDTLRFAWLVFVCKTVSFPFIERCYNATRFPPLEVPVVVH